MAKKFRMGPKAAAQMRRLSGTWKQGEHVLVSGATGSGKTLIARQLDQIRINKGGHVVVFVCKLRPDETILTDYSTKDGWIRWKRWKKRPAPHERMILLWPETEKHNYRDALKLQQEVFTEAMEHITKTGRWTVHVDEGLYFCHPEFLNMAHDLAMGHQMGRSGKLTFITLTQRPAHLPLVIYSSASHAFIGRAREATDVKRLSELGGRENARSLAARIEGQGRHDFLWIPVAPDWEPEPINLGN